MDIMEYGVSLSWCREFTVQGFDPVDQGLRKFVEFCTSLELCEPSEGKPKQNNTHDTDDCFELNQRKKRTKLNTSHHDKDKVSYKDLTPSSTPR
eukprot:9587004-Ditylum_brightwellii.AAC.1